MRSSFAVVAVLAMLAAAAMPALGRQLKTNTVPLCVPGPQLKIALNCPFDKPYFVCLSNIAGAPTGGCQADTPFEASSGCPAPTTINDPNPPQCYYDPSQYVKSEPTLSVGTVYKCDFQSPCPIDKFYCNTTHDCPAVAFGSHGTAPCVDRTTGLLGYQCIQKAITPVNTVPACRPGDHLKKASQCPPAQKMFVCVDPTKGSAYGMCQAKEQGPIANTVCPIPKSTSEASPSQCFIDPAQYVVSDVTKSLALGTIWECSWNTPCSDNHFFCGGTNACAPTAWGSGTAKICIDDHGIPAFQCRQKQRV